MKQQTTLGRIIAAGEFLIGSIHAILLIVFATLVAMVAAAWIGAPFGLVVAAGAAGLLAGIALSRRLWFPRSKPDRGPVRATARESHVPGVQDHFERLRRRQYVLGGVLVFSLLALGAVRIAYYEDWPAVFGIPRHQVLTGALVAAAVVLPLGLLNWRCPNCKANLGRSLSILQCPKCGVVLRG